MSQIMKTFMGIFIVLFMTVCSMGILGAFLQVSSAQEFHTGMIDELENSDYSKAVLEECFIDAETKGYKLQVILYGKQGGYHICSRKEDIPSGTQNIEMAKVDLQFAITIPFMGVDKEQKISGYGR